jgi:hypothetical protein
MRILVEAIPIFSPIAAQTPNAFSSIISLTLFITTLIVLPFLNQFMQFK